MAIYKPPKARWPLAVFAGVLGILVGLALGAIVTRDTPDAAEGVRLVQQELSGAAAGLEVAGIEYAEAVDGTDVVNETEYRASLDALESSRSRFEKVESALAILAPERASEIAAAYDEAAGAMEAEAAEEEVRGLLEDLDALLKGDEAGSS